MRNLVDLAALKSWLKDARIVSMGQAAHATRDFQEFKLRTLQLGRVARVHDFGDRIAPGGRADRGRLRGRQIGRSRYRVCGRAITGGGPSSSPHCSAGYATTTRTPARTRKVKFAGFDIRAIDMLERRVLDYLARVNEPRLAQVAQVFAELGKFCDTPSTLSSTIHALKPVPARFFQHNQIHY
jgi:hypothetical protein